MGVITLVGNCRVKSKNKLQGVTYLMGGYSDNRVADVYYMYNPIKNVIYDTRDVIWLGIMYFNHSIKIIDTLPLVSSKE